jgi:hypothetical protein
MAKVAYYRQNSEACCLCHGENDVAAVVSCQSVLEVSRLDLPVCRNCIATLVVEAMRKKLIAGRSRAELTAEDREMLGMPRADYAGFKRALAALMREKNTNTTAPPVRVVSGDEVPPAVRDWFATEIRRSIH